MESATRRIGLSLGADICWPICFEEIVRRLDLAIPWRGEEVRIEVERVTIEPYDLQQEVRYDLVIDRLTHWYHTSREWIKKAVILDDVYVLNNPWSIQSMEKQTTYCAMMRLGLPIPRTWMVPPKEYEPTPDLEPTLERYAQLFDLGNLGRELGYPLFMKPYDGGAWRGVSKIDDETTLRRAYEESGKLVMHLQKAVSPFDLFVRCIGLGPQVRIVRYDPDAPLHDRYTTSAPDIDAAERKRLEDTTLTINTFFGWDFNSCEALRGEDRVFHPIDFANACPDSQVTSLHYHFPWLVLAKVRWAIFCAVTRRRMRKTLDWEPYFEVAASDRTIDEKVEAYGEIARRRLDAEGFAAFCEEHLGDLDSVALEFFRDSKCRDAVRQKVAALFPKHEVEQFTELFWGRIGRWVEDELGPRVDGPGR